MLEQPLKKRGLLNHSISPKGTLLKARQNKKIRQKLFFFCLSQCNKLFLFKSLICQNIYKVCSHAKYDNDSKCIFLRNGNSFNIYSALISEAVTREYSQENTCVGYFNTEQKDSNTSVFQVMLRNF